MFRNLIAYQIELVLKRKTEVIIWILATNLDFFI